MISGWMSISGLMSRKSMKCRFMLLIGVVMTECSFCGYESEFLITGPDVYICEDCVGLCAEIVEVQGLIRENRELCILPTCHVEGESPIG